MKAYTKDVIRSIVKGRKRFFALMLITALGVCMFCGIKAGCDDLRYSADVFFDEQNLYDISIVSTLGLTEDDVKAVSGMEGVEAVEGTYTEDVYTDLNDGSRKQATMKVLSEKGINMPYLLEGKLPEQATEVLVTLKYIEESGKKVGDMVSIEEDISVEEDDDEEDEDEDIEEPNFIFRYYRIVGVAIDVMDINSSEGAVAFRNNSTTDYIFYVHKGAVKSDVYTAMYLTLQGTDELACYTDAYEQKVDEIVTLLEEEIKEDREQARYDKIIGDALDEIADAEEEMWEAFEEAESEIADAVDEIADGWAELTDAENELKQAERDLAKAERDLDAGERELTQGETEYASGLAQYEAAKAEVEAGEQALKEAESTLDESEKTLDESEAQLKESEKQLDEEYPAAIAYLDNQIAQKKLAIKEAGEAGDTEKQTLLEDELKQLEDARADMVEEETTAREEIANGYIEIENARKEIADGRKEIKKNRSELKKGKQELADAKVELDDARKKLDDGWKEITDGWKELTDGEQEIFKGWDEIEDAVKELEDGQIELDENVAEYESEKADALQEIGDAKKDIADIKMTEWYITTRTSLSGYNNIKTDADCIEAIGQAFPVLFMTIAILISLTTMSRMIEEDRGLIGTYKALGFSDDEIRRKYVLYALIACIIGGILGDFLAYIVLAEILFIVFDVMYQVPEYIYTFDLFYGIGGIVMFVAGIVGAAYVSCNSVLRSTPAMLMRAKPPSSGSRVLLERITPIWSRLSFLNKVTARNLFRYKKRLFMTLFGIAGCTALLLTGFTIKDTVVELLPLQYEETYRYDVMVVAQDNEKLLECLEERSDVRKYINTMVTNVKLIAENGKEETVQLVVIPDEENISRFIRLYDMDGERQKLTDEDVFVTTNLSVVMDFEEEDFLLMQNMNLVQADVEVTKIVMNYLGNSIYMTETMYEDSFEEKFEPNAAYILLNLKDEKQDGFVEDLEAEDGILTVMGYRDMMEGFNSAMYIINMVVYIVIVLAGALAFVVLFTLATTNISERERELATIKVLGFYDVEVHSYVNKETLILTGLGIILGMPIGKLMGEWLMSILEMPSIYFYTTLYPESYAYSAIIAIVFALLVNLMTNKSLNKINPVEALKSIE
ncbi:MAG: FtsX-like permease family protein [Roseburia sp.]|nr:FtsX-like permease family protein [Roseburia sp.]